MNSVGDFGPQLIQLFKEEALDLLAQWENACLALQSRQDTDAWDQLFASVHSLKGSIQTLGLHIFAEYLAEIEDYMSKGSAELVSNQHLVALLTAQTQSTVWVTTVETIDENDIRSEIKLIRKILSNTDNADKRNNTSGKSKTVNRERKSDQNNSQTKTTVVTEPEINDDVRVSGKLIDTFLDQLCEIQTHQKILASYFQYGNVSKDIANQSLTLSQTRIRELRRQVTDLRSVTAETVYKRLQRTVAEANLVLGKNVQLKFTGKSTKIDKTIADQIVAPLIHLVKNCVDHGIEGSEERIRSNKEADGQVNVVISRHVKNIEIVIEDNGRGIDAQSILKKALANGIINTLPPESDIDNEQLLQLLCEPGFSTSDSINEVSGRGVGMHAVVEKIHSIGGSLEMDYTKNAGTKFTIVTPNSFTSLKAIVVKINDFKIAIPMNEVNEVCSFKNDTLECTLGEMKLEHNSDIMRYLHLDNLFSGTVKKSSSKEKLFGLISGKGRAKSIYGVDSIVGQQEVVIRPLDKGLTNLPGCQGAAYFSDGSPGLVVSLKKLALSDTTQRYH